MNDQPVEGVIVTVVIGSFATLVAHVAQVDGRARHGLSNKRASTPCQVSARQRLGFGEW